ncbi:MAG: hypothetical protein EZS28_009119 [Streblomastix strix]|uniref:Uncharacterized protein n=1 Tax=Streblomastix strix TaxID=222440 RepID=A0A5J4WJY5_9EUKA|nr:MAG: hypothetical protein EZS28_009119 [Streblomastix strix]
MALSRQHQNLKNINAFLPEPTAPTIQWFPLTRNKEFLVNGPQFLGAKAIISVPSRSIAKPSILLSSNKSPSTIPPNMLNQYLLLQNATCPYPNTCA